jgi:hypothetical protein
LAFQSFRKPLLDFMGKNPALHQVASEIVDEPRSLTRKGSALKLFQTTILLFANRYAPCAMRFAEHGKGV